MVPSPVCVAAKHDVNHTRLGRNGSTRKSQNPAFKSGKASVSLKPLTALHDHHRLLIRKAETKDDLSCSKLTQDMQSLSKDQSQETEI